MDSSRSTCAFCTRDPLTEIVHSHHFSDSPNGLWMTIDSPGPEISPPARVRGLVASAAVEDVDLSDIEKELCRLPDVNAVRIVTDAVGRPKEIHVLAGTNKQPKQVARDIQSVAMATFGLEIDHRIISVVQLVEPGDGTVAPVGPARVAIVGISSEQNGLRNLVRVTLRHGEHEATGFGEGSIAELARHRTVAQATLDALRQLLPAAESADVETAGVVRVGAREVSVVTLVFVMIPHEEIVSGSAIVRRGDEAEAIARAVLDGTNRRVA